MHFSDCPADDYLTCLERARAASSKISEFSHASLVQCQVRFFSLGSSKMHHSSWS